MSRQRSLYQSVLAGNDRSVSPVIGVILMVAITVILAAVIGGFVLGFTNNFGDSPPQASLEAEEETLNISQGSAGTPLFREYTAVTITHSSGENIDKGKISVTVNGENAYATARPPANFYTVTDPGRNDPIRPWDTVDDTITVGDQTTIILGTDIIVENDLSVGSNNIVFAHGGPISDPWLVDAEGTIISQSDGAALSSGDTIRVIWESGDQSTSLLEYEV